MPLLSGKALHSISGLLPPASFERVIIQIYCEDMVKFEPLGLVDRHHIDTGKSPSGIRRGISRFKETTQLKEGFLPGHPRAEIEQVKKGSRIGNPCGTIEG
jgi:hypothetical protein